MDEAVRFGGHCLKRLSEGIIARRSRAARTLATAADLPGRLSLQHLGMLTSVSELYACVRLFDQFMFGDGSSEFIPMLGDLHSAWRIIAARQGVLAVYHFGVCLKQFHNDSFKISKDTDRQKTAAQAWSLYDENFRDAEKLRDAVSHANEPFRNETLWSAGILREDFRSEDSFKSAGIIAGGLAGHRLSQVWAGKNYQLTIDSQAVALLQRILILIGALPPNPAL